MYLGIYYIFAYLGSISRHYCAFINVFMLLHLPVSKFDSVGLTLVRLTLTFEGCRRARKLCVIVLLHDSFSIYKKQHVDIAFLTDLFSTYIYICVYIYLCTYMLV